MVPKTKHYTRGVSYISKTCIKWDFVGAIISESPVKLLCKSSLTIEQMLFKGENNIFGL